MTEEGSRDRVEGSRYHGITGSGGGEKGKRDHAITGSRDRVEGSRYHGITGSSGGEKGKRDHAITGSRDRGGGAMMDHGPWTIDHSEERGAGR